jgi:flavin-dependent dehydrogenase
LTANPVVDDNVEALGAAKQFRQAGFLRHEGAWIERDGKAHFRAFGSGWLGFQAPRHRFDGILLKCAAAAGVEIKQPCRVLAPVVHQGTVWGFDCAQGRIVARFVLDGTGPVRWLARAMRIPLRQESPRLLAQYGYVRGDCPGRDRAPRFTLLDNGWEWTARVEPGRYHFTKLVVNGRPEQGYLPAEFAGLDSDGEVRVLDVSWRIAQPCAGPGYFLLGDAAALLDPSSSHGVLRAILSGMMAAYLIRKVFCDDISEELSTMEYNRWMQRSFDQDASRLRAHLGWS